MKSLAKAMALGNSTHDAQFEARLQANYAYVLSNWVNVDAAAIEVPKLRQIAVRTGDARTTITFHTLAAQLNAKRGRITNAITHAEIARALLDKHQNYWQQGRLAIVAYAISSLQSDYLEALRHTEEAIECAEKSGSREIMIPALGNLALIQLVQNELGSVKTTLTTLFDELRKRGTSTAEIAFRDIDLQIALLERDAVRASIKVEEISKLIADTEASDSDYELWHLLTRVRWLYISGGIDDGLALALNAIPKIQSSKDRALLERMTLLAAEGYARSGQTQLASKMLRNALDHSTDRSLDLIAETYRVGGRIVASEDRVTGASHVDRASRVLRHIGHLSAHVEAERDLAEISEPNDSTIKSLNQAAQEANTSNRFRDHAAELSHDISVLLESGKHPPLLGCEALSLLAATNAIQRAAVMEIAQDGTPRVIAELATTDEIEGRETCVALGKLAVRKYELRFVPRLGAAASVSLVAVQNLVQSAIRLARSRELEREALDSWPTYSEGDLGLIYSSERMSALVKTIRQVSGSNVTILLVGETGVGKELFAKAVHRASPRSEKAFLPFNCGTVARDLLDSQLFGHRRGSFTGAHADSAGVIRSAAGGTLFLDEIGEMPLETQPKLLRFLESGEILPLGENKPLTVDVRVVAATNANLDQMVADGRFREDLYYRLNVIRIPIPPLRDRREEIPALVEHFLERFGRELQKPMLRVADETLEYLVLYRWPGNVRQLSNELRRMVALAEPGAVLMPAHLSDDIVASRKTIPAGQAPRGFSEVITRIDQPLAAAVEHIERAAIQRALSITDGNLIEAAKVLGLSRKGLYLKRQRLKLG
jgi:DNA-binding NtrC family response regulator